ncbi:MAG: metallophosphoesterase family protein [Solirubrobacterales bacterium]
MTRDRNKTYSAGRPLGLGALAILLALSVSALAAAVPAAAGSETQTADRKGLRSNGEASRLSSGKLALKDGRQAYLRFSVPSSWGDSRVVLVLDPSTSSSGGLAVRRAKVTWKRGTPTKGSGSGQTVLRSGAVTRSTTARMDVTSLLPPGKTRNLRLTATGGVKASLARTPYLVRYDPPTTVAAVGDIACSASSSSWNGGQGTATACRQAAVAALVEESDEAVLALGDNQYQSGTLAEFQTGFGVSWSGLSPRLKPTPGNHEYYTAGAAGYYDYFASLGVETGGAGTGYYGYDLGDWRALSMNSNCSDVPCSAGSAQETWFRQELQTARNEGKCTIAYWHHPVASSGMHGDQAAVRDLWRAFVELGGDVALAGHDHHYERFGPLDADLQPTTDGPRSWVVGTGGINLRPATGRTGTEKLITDAFGLLRLDLAADSYEWNWIGVDGVGSDTGSSDCRG